mgnify:CR=1 FL=1
MEDIEDNDIKKSATIRRAAMDLLARREHSHTELFRKLLRRFSHDSELIESEIETLNREGLQSDLRLAEAFTRSRANKGQGPLKIRAELRDKGVVDSDIEIAFAHCDINWFDQVALVAGKRFGNEPPEDAKERAKRNRFLQQRGFSFDEIDTLN